MTSFIKYVLLITSCFKLLVFASPLKAQSPDELIPDDGLNIAYLEHLIKSKVDQVRLKHQLSPLLNDSLLFVTARYHTSYMFDNNELTHYEKTPHLKTPADRVRFFGGQNMSLTKMAVYFNLMEQAHALISSVPETPEIVAYRLNVNYRENPDSEYIKELHRYAQMVPQDVWCRLFFSPCGIPFQALDHSPTRTLFCKTCNPNNLNIFEKK